MSRNSNLDEFDILSSIWILSCNDENSLITYEGLIYRLNISENINLRELISKRGDLFRLKVPPKRLDNWKEAMIQGLRRPSFINVMATEQAKIAKINSITVNDVFRNQFRSEDNAPKASIEILNWGLQHIDRLRQTRIDNRENNFKKFSVLYIPLLSLIITFLTVIGGYYYQLQMKKYEVTFRSKQDNYSKFMQGLYDTFESSRKNYPFSNQELIQNINQLEITYFNIEPFLNTNQQKNIWNRYQRFSYMCLNFNKKINDNSLTPKEYDVTVNAYSDSLLTYKEEFHKRLYPILFQQ
ncbi:hypothetical protein HDF19_16735 [Mucilaginibacter sp. E4BP6]|uniref:hypothetical protein n=1 Tax=Mucilaginibacter sp. E4BP6 TaxID=2723089 RepID=UPI0015CEF108|nr:hypothetical protein [Mucilaginibacter sp. E4BP6]NYE66464.1 hypothetical protein [Mucilaginibacter sp. E4BP6]